MVRQRVRIRFAKQGNLRLIGHMDLVRTWERLLRRAGIRPRVSMGFTPRPRMSFPSALSVGICGTDELMELELADDAPATPAALLAALGQHAPAGLVVHRVEPCAAEGRWAEVHAVEFELPLPTDRCAELESRIDQFLAGTQCVCTRADGRKTVDIRPYVEQLRLSEGRLHFRLHVTRQGAARPRELLAALGLDDLETQGYWLTRTRVEVRP